MIDRNAISWRYSNIFPKCCDVCFLFVKLLTVWNATHAPGTVMAAVVPIARQLTPTLIQKHKFKIWIVHHVK